NVNIVEQTRSPTEEYTCRVGGVAANQVGRVKIELDEFEKLHGKVKEEEFRGILKFERSLLMQPVQQRFPINQQILFDRNNPDDPDWLDKPDDYGVTNCEKLLYVNNILQRAWNQYLEDYTIQWNLAIKAFMYQSSDSAIAALPLPPPFNKI